MEPLLLSTKQRADYQNQAVVEKDEGFPTILSTWVESRVPLLTIVNCTAQLYKCDGSYSLLRKPLAAFGQSWSLGSSVKRALELVLDIGWYICDRIGSSCGNCVLYRVVKGHLMSGFFDSNR